MEANESMKPILLTMLLLSGCAQHDAQYKQDMADCDREMRQAWYMRMTRVSGWGRYSEYPDQRAALQFRERCMEAAGWSK
jgi:hypothetical protein